MSTYPDVFKSLFTIIMLIDLFEIKDIRLKNVNKYFLFI